MRHYKHNGVVYLILPDGRILTEKFMAPPEKTIHEIETAMADELAAEDATIQTLDGLLNKARELKKNKKFSRARTLVERALKTEPRNVHLVAMYSSILRSQNQSEKALEITQPFAYESNAALQTTRAAALLDEGRGAEAVAHAKRAYAISKTSGNIAPELNALFGRLKKEGHIS